MSQSLWDCLLEETPHPVQQEAPVAVFPLSVSEVHRPYWCLVIWLVTRHGDRHQSPLVHTSWHFPGQVTWVLLGPMDPRGSKAGPPAAAAVLQVAGFCSCPKPRLRPSPYFACWKKQMLVFHCPFAQWLSATCSRCGTKTFSFGGDAGRVTVFASLADSLTSKSVASLLMNSNF